MNTPSKPLTHAAECRRDFTPKLKRSQVLEMGRRYGYSPRTMRDLIEGPHAPVKRETFGRQTRGYFDRDKLIEQMFPNQD